MTNQFRHELKHVINAMDAEELRRRLGASLPMDVHSGQGGSYLIKSLYFDTPSDLALREKVDGVLRRVKFRIRSYNNDLNFIRLEKKIKVDQLTKKESTTLSLHATRRLLQGDIGVLMQNADPLCLELYARMQTQALRPRCVVEYTRQAFVFRPGNVRITLDTGIRGANNPNAFLQTQMPSIPVGNLGILEIKYDQFCPQYVVDLCQLSSRKAGAFSKYAAVRLAYH